MTITIEEALKTIKTLKEYGNFISDEKLVRNITKKKYSFNNCDFDLFYDKNEIVKIEISHYLLDGKLYNLEERYVK